MHFLLGLHCLPKYPFRGFQYTKGLLNGISMEPSHYVKRYTVNDLGPWPCLDTKFAPVDVCILKHVAIFFTYIGAQNFRTDKQSQVQIIKNIQRKIVNSFLPIISSICFGCSRTVSLRRSF